jgi:hypothetical protein
MLGPNLTAELSLKSKEAFVLLLINLRAASKPFNL